MAASGFTREKLEDAISIDVWPDCWPAVQVFRSATTQWRHGFAGAIGLDYNALPFLLRMQRVARADWPGVFGDISVMEAAALRLFREGNDG